MGIEHYSCSSICHRPSTCSIVRHCCEVRLTESDLTLLVASHSFDMITVGLRQLLAVTACRKDRCSNTLYIAPIADVITSHNVLHSQYVDEIHLNIGLSEASSETAMSESLVAIHQWFSLNRLALNPTSLKQLSSATALDTGSRVRSGLDWVTLESRP